MTPESKIEPRVDKPRKSFRPPLRRIVEGLCYSATVTAIYQFASIKWAVIEVCKWILNCLLWIASLLIWWGGAIPAGMSGTNFPGWSRRSKSGSTAGLGNAPRSSGSSGWSPSGPRPTPRP